MANGSRLKPPAGLGRSPTAVSLSLRWHSLPVRCVAGSIRSAIRENLEKKKRRGAFQLGSGGNNCGGDSRNRKYVKVKRNCHNKGLLDPRLWAVSVAFSSACTSIVHASQCDKLLNFMFCLTRGGERLPNATACHWRIHYPTLPDATDVRHFNNYVWINFFFFFSIILPFLFISILPFVFILYWLRVIFYTTFF